MKIYVGLSGGVDSAVSAALLKEAGHEVVGAFIKIWSPEFIACTWKEDRADALRVCAALGIPFREIDLSSTYRREVVEDMVHTYQAGMTPNPDVVCNRQIKFGSFASWAFAEGAEMIATGHYARIEKRNGTYSLLRAVDEAKDQSYFLYRLTQDDLVRTLFPIGGMHKAMVRAKARAWNLPVSHKPDSQGLCFAGDVSIPEFLSRYLNLKKGIVFDEEGNKIGEHDGAALYTAGQRHGLRTQGGPHYVVRTDIATNTVIASREKTHAYASSALLRDISWIGMPPKDGEMLTAQARYHAAPAFAQLDGTRIRFSSPELLSPGQSVVLYREAECLGGGVVEKVVRE